MSVIAVHIWSHKCGVVAHNKVVHNLEHHKKRTHNVPFLSPPFGVKSRYRTQNTKEPRPAVPKTKGNPAMAHAVAFDGASAEPLASAGSILVITPASSSTQQSTSHSAHSCSLLSVASLGLCWVFVLFGDKYSRDQGGCWGSELDLSLPMGLGALSGYTGASVRGGCSPGGG